MTILSKNPQELVNLKGDFPSLAFLENRLIGTDSRSLLDFTSL